MVLGRRPKYRQKRIFHSFLFVIQNVASDYTLRHLQNWFFHLYVSLKPFHGKTSEAVVRKCSSKWVFLKFRKVY